MPKLNKTMLDQLASMMKASGSKKPAIIQEIDWRDPLGYTIEQRRAIARNPEHFQKLSMTPNRKRYQEGIDALIDARKRPIREKYEDVSGELEDVQNEFGEAFDEAKEGLVEDIRSDMNYFEAPDIQYGFDTDFRGDLFPDLPERSLEDYWPSRFKAPGWYNDRGYELGDLMDEYESQLHYMETPEHRMEVQRQSPRYRNYQRAMMQRAENVRLGRLNAKIMSLARQGYSMPEIREILNGTMPTPAVGGR